MRFWISLFRLDGRLNRLAFWKLYFQSIVVQLVAFVLLLLVAINGLVAGPILFLLAGVLALLVLWPTIALGAQRLHDRDRSAHFVWPYIVLPSMLDVLGEESGRLAFTVPAAVLGLWGLAEIGFRAGTHGPNRYGPDPLAGSGGVAAPELS